MTENTGHPANSYYTATAHKLAPQPVLAGDQRADICIVGAGYTGLGAALAFAERGLSVIILEAAEIGSGASGRNGGQVHSGQRRDQDYLENLVGLDGAKALWAMAEEAKAHLKGLIARYRIECDYKNGILVADHKPHYVAMSQAYAEKLRTVYGYDKVEAVDKQQLDALLGASGYHGGFIDHDGGHLHPLNLALGLARAALDVGVRIYERSRAVGYESKGGKALVRTDKGSVSADWLILAGDGYLSGLDAYTEARVMPINNFLLATQPFSDNEARALIANDYAVADSRFVVNYYRLSADRRLIFGGGENYGRGFPADMKAFVRKRMLKVFPQLADKPIDYAWGGTLGITTTRLPFVRRLAPNVLTASGYSGQGVMLAPYFGKILADVTAATLGEFDRLAVLPTPPFPGGRLLRWPTLVAGMSYFALRDRL
ncbi:gamma-glutamylputrescine oxidase [Labrys miyagiensis]|uniref:Gamma-glutamylputrescine oxidase n=1 Tax=Labrys miyagiensis TaxID=346912 RepID=A0ABQ6CE76_9HYPH|nr:FAD-binding oxidoreductase [Labrys miyagiensis]GLS17110.1 gamma-glutamylputrescine oxidase [Labrys miyagiensis]